MGNTLENLHGAFAGESKASRKYVYFAEKAEKDGYSQISRLFRAVSEAETVHARNHLESMGGIGTTNGNLETAIEMEHYEFTTMYPGFIEQSKSDNDQMAETSFTYANQVEKIHHSLYQDALKAVGAGQSLKDEPYFVCQVCGNTVAGGAPETCPICGTSRSKFKRVE